MAWLALVRRNPRFARFLLSEAVSLVGDWFSVVAISVLAVQEGQGHGAWAVAVTLAAHDLPMGLVRPFAGLLADRFDRRNLLFGVHVGQALITVCMAWRAAVADVPGLQLLVVARSLLAGLDWPARSGALRRLVSTEDLLVANALGGALWSSMFAFGMALGGLVASYGVAFALAVDASTFAVAAALIATLPAMPTRGGVPWREAAGRAFSDLREAARVATADPALLRAVASRTPLALAGGAGVVLLNLVADRTAFAATGAATLGLLQAVRGIGTGVGPLVAERFVARGVPMTRVWRGVAAAGFVGIGMLASVSAPWALFVAVAVWGFGVGANWVIASAETQRLAPDEAVGRLSGLDMLAVEVGFALSALLGGAIAESTGVDATSGAVGVGLGCVSWLAVEAAAIRSRAR